VPLFNQATTNLSESHTKVQDCLTPVGKHSSEGHVESAAHGGKILVHCLKPGSERRSLASLGVSFIFQLLDFISRGQDAGANAVAL
jgi:hypothetical protein